MRQADLYWKKVLLVNRIVAAMNRFPSGFFFAISCDCHCCIWPLWQVNVTDSMLPTVSLSCWITRSAHFGQPFSSLSRHDSSTRYFFSPPGEHPSSSSSRDTMSSSLSSSSLGICQRDPGVHHLHQRQHPHHSYHHQQQHFGHVSVKVRV